MDELDPYALAHFLGCDQKWADRLNHALQVSFMGHSILTAYLNGEDFASLNKSKLKEKCDLVITLAGA